MLVAADSDEALCEILDRDEFPRVTVMGVTRLNEPILVGLG